MKPSIALTKTRPTILVKHICPVEVSRKEGPFAEIKGLEIAKEWFYLLFSSFRMQTDRDINKQAELAGHDLCSLDVL